jgi:phosphoribosylglycinamide formyltransferase-1
MIVLGVLVSGSGTNLQAVLDAIAARTLDARVAVVVSNVAGAPAVDRARSAGVAAVVIEHTHFADRRAFDTAVVQTLRDQGVEIVVLAGFMRILSDVLLDAFPQRIVNVHPSLLPAFPGVHAQEQALQYGVRIAGCTVHLVDGGTDTGPIVAQAAVPVFDDDDENELRARILAKEHELLPRVLQWMAEGRVNVEPARTAGGRARVRVRGVWAATAGVDGVPTAAQAQVHVED